MHLWLDEAMEGPNPASILRNSVVVTCGAIVLLKVMPILQHSPVALVVLLVIGSISAIGGSLVAIAQVDIKRTLSYSTTAHLGLVFIAIALQIPVLALLLLFSHAVSKALLSMSIGGVIASTNCQDITELGGLASRMPATTTAYLVGGAGLVGFLPLGGFLAMAQSIELLSVRSVPFMAVFLLTNALTALDLVRVFRHVFLGDSLIKSRRAAEVNWQMALPMVALTVIVLLTPVLLVRLESLDGLLAFPLWAAALVVGSGLVGLVAGALLPLSKAWSRSLNPVAPLVPGSAGLRLLHRGVSTGSRSSTWWPASHVWPPGLTARWLTACSMAWRGCLCRAPRASSSASADRGSPMCSRSWSPSFSSSLR